MNKPRVAAIVVTYFPDSKVVIKTIEGLRGQADTVVIVDNTPGGSDVFRDGNLLGGKNDIELITLKKNVGIAEGQNIGIKKALAGGTGFVLLSDQDTQYPEDYVSKMLEAYVSIVKKEKIAAIAPDFAELNRGGERQGFMVLDGMFLKRIHPKSGCHEITQAIASGIIIPLKAIDAVGFMKEALFIDWVDFEWCWRARAKGFVIIGCADVVIQHALGDAAKKIGSKSYPIRSPIRHYYTIRNGVYLALRDKNITPGMRINILAKTVRYFIGFTALGKPHRKHFAYCLRGLYHGIIGRLGVYR